MKLLLDSHCLLWALFNPERLGERAQALIADRENAIFVSYVSLWEITVKIAKGKLIVSGRSIQKILEEMQDLGFDYLPLKGGHLVMLESLPAFDDHKDPFDRLIVAQAILEDMPLLSIDAKIRRYPVTTIWR